jgi:hypothetical protein
VLEGESATGGVGNSASGTASGGNYRGFTVPAGSSFGRIGQWQLTAAELAKYAGRSYRLLAAFTNAVAGTMFKFVVMFPQGAYVSTASESAEVSLTGGILQDLGTITLPPWLPGASSYQSLDLTMWAYRTGGSYTLNLDCLFLVPTDSYRLLSPQGYGFYYGSKLVDDGITGLTWIESGGNRAGYYVGFGRRLKVWPGVTTRLYIHCEMQAGDFTALVMSARLFYRPRRLTV